MFPVTSSLKISPIHFKPSVLVPSNTDCTCHSYWFSPAMTRECLPSFLPALYNDSMEDSRRKHGCGREVGHCYFLIWCQWQIIVVIGMVRLPYPDAEYWNLLPPKCSWYRQNMLPGIVPLTKALDPSQRHCTLHPRCWEGSLGISSRNHQW